MKSGIYYIRCNAEGPDLDRVYVGSSVDIGRRWKCHRKMLRTGKHHAKQLQEAWDLYGGEAFSFEIVEDASKETLQDREQYWIDETGAFGLGFNGLPTAYSPKGSKHSSETKAKMADARRLAMADPAKRARIGECSKRFMGSPEGKALASSIHKGKVVSQATRDKLSASRRADWQNPEYHEKMRIAMTGRRMTPEGRERLKANRAKTRAAKVELGV